jgi:hypothetical protein
MISFKTIKLDDNNKIIFKFYEDLFTVDIDLIDSKIHMTKNHDEFNNIIIELKSNFNIDSHKIKLIRFWYNKNYKKIFPLVTYVTKYGRTIKQDN